MGQQLDDELQMYKRMERGSKNHPGRSAVRSLLDSFDVDGPEDKHRCLVHPPLWDSVLTFLHRNPEQRLPAPVLAFVLKRLFLALDYLHTECQIIHAGIYSGGPMDIWNIFEGESLFTGYDPESHTYRSRAHLAEIIKLLGPPSPSLLARGKLSHKFFSDEDDLCAKVLSEGRIPLEKRETTLQGQDKADFLRLMLKMLQWDPANRSSARELQEDEWICKTLE
ncbi:hypothetical protein KXX13_006852 [Aspergillus fumigatus]|nr:hypothetical protein KXX11_009203 [Aspergillus fumigatus]KAH1334524.1 hypothetical protein KXX67_006000 [Aspergillus fumigatus]KAH1440887.1 hypothetical protein KXX13_006852 [Aspergillus fumigatus]KAH1520900.1 hypothetical protein KXX18_006402 [Aspergillus fumigatus]KAH1599363.1 hypothetical protein KXX34_007213 [Aspergillus fumigatus]